MLYQDILMHVNRYEQVTEITKASFSSELDQLCLRNYVRALCRLEQGDEIRKLIEGCQREGYPFHCRADRIAQWVAIEYALMGDTLSAKQYVSIGLGMTPESRGSEAILHFLGDHYSTAAALYREASENATIH